MQKTIDDTARTESGAEDLVHLHVSPLGFEAILNALPDARAARVAYDSKTETLEIMAPSAEHDSNARLFDALILGVGLECDIEIETLGSVTLKRHESGMEPDSCFYIGEHASAVRGKKQIDLGNDPPPDIAVEVDISRARYDKGRFYAAIGVPEFWRYDGTILEAYVLRTDTYVETSTSVAFPWLAIKVVQQFLQMGPLKGKVATIRAWQAWLRTIAPGG